jgi:DNA-binding CsgD family transcriptional regulator/tetratricopeptide (TPR) repeat protein
VLVTQRGSNTDDLDLRHAVGDRCDEIDVGPLSLGALHHVIRTRLGIRLPRPAVARIHAASGGNPMFGLEFAKGAAASTGPFELPESLESLVRERLARLPARVRLALAAVAASERATVSLLEAAIEDVAPLIDVAAAEGAIAVDDQGFVRFTHPLLGSGAYALVPPVARRKLHARLAAATSSQEQRVRHLALSTVGPDAGVAGALDEAAALARSRGAPDAAAELARLAIRLTPADDVTAHETRTLLAAGYEAAAGNAGAARDLLEELLAGSVTGERRAQGLLMLSDVEEVAGRMITVGTEALEHAGSDAALRIRALAGIAIAEAEIGDIAVAENTGERALAVAEELEDPALIAHALSVVGFIRELAGRPEPELLERAVALSEGRYLTTPSRPGLVLALVRLWHGELAAARMLLEAELDAAYTWGDETHMETIRRLFIGLEWHEGNWDSAERRLEEHARFVFDAADRAAEVFGLWQGAILDAARGRVERARERAGEAMRVGEENHIPLFVANAWWILGFLELSLGSPEAAWHALQHVPEAPNPRLLWFRPDTVEAALATGRVDEGLATLGRLEEEAEARGHHWALAAVQRCRALEALARGEAGDAASLAEKAAASFEQLGGFPLDRGRAHLVAGEARRRLGERRRAAEQLTAARSLFAAVGAPLWAARADAELKRASPRPRRDGGLTNAERRVAALVSIGLTNREVAAQLNTTVGTVEVHLTRIYRKTSVRSRTELTRLVADGALDLGDG